MAVQRVFFVVVLLFLVMMPFSDLDAQCAMCKEAAESTLKNNPNSMARSLNKGILYLMAVPYIAIAFIFRKQLYQVWLKLLARFSGKPGRI